MMLGVVLAVKTGFIRLMVECTYSVNFETRGAHGHGLSAVKTILMTEAGGASSLMETVDGACA